jgi:DEAD/DEAH box helicase domain-containing protein
MPARVGVSAPWPQWVPEPLHTALTSRGIEALWRHQVEVGELVRSGQHVIISTATASGKSLAYLLPVLSHLLEQPRATALYLSPTKALAADQLRSVSDLGLTDVRASGYDGDTPHAERDWVRSHGRLVLTNPDMLHRSILPRHEQWSSFLRRLSFVIIDESHVYRGVFGSHMAQVIRRLRRVLARYGVRTPIFVLASATAGDPATSATRLTGLPVRAVTEDASPRGGVTFGLWEPPLLPGVGSADDSRPGDGADSRPGDGAYSRPGDGAPVRRSALTETADLLADAVAHGVQTLAFVRSRRGAEVVAASARRSLSESVPELADRVAAYRAGYLREERRRLERDLLDGSLLGLAATNALELGIDVAGLDAVILSGYPGTVASLWQQSGRAGRTGSDALCVLVARDDPLDTYLVHHPDALFDRAVETTVLDPSNPYVLAPHLCCAAAELPLTESDLPLFGGDAVRPVLDALVAAGSLRRRPTGWYWAVDGRPDIDLRGTGGNPVAVVETSTGQLLGTVDAGAAHVQVHEGAVYLHQGTSYVVDRLDLVDASALVHAEEPDWTTHPRDVTGLDVLAVRSYVDAGPVGLFLGDVDVTNQVVSYQRRRLGSREVIDTRPLDLPVRQLRTVAVWWTVSPRALDAAGVTWPDVPGALHAAEHAAIGLLPLVATCDRWDIGGLSTAVHPDTGTPAVFVYDGHQGGAGFAERAFHTALRWLDATRTAIAECGCESGCPSCVHSPKCGNGNEPLHKPGAIAVLDVVLAALAGRTRVTPGVVPAPRDATGPLTDTPVT